jgi:hypothetical protein
MQMERLLKPEATAVEVWRVQEANEAAAMRW